MRIFALDTAEKTCGMAIIADGSLIAEMTLVNKLTHSRHLMEMIDAILRMSEIRLSEIDAFAVGQGPGSFTGLRIGISVVKGLALASGKPIIGISNSDALADQCFRSLTLAARNPLPICVMTDARRSEVYTCRYRFEDGKSCRETEPEALSPDKAILGIREEYLFVGTGALLYRELIRKHLGDLAIFAPDDAHNPRASTIARLASDRLANNDTDDMASFAPQYIRKPEFRLMSEAAMPLS